jgi:predicted lipoprotein with Yx(FWY)xxD motif
MRNRLAGVAVGLLALALGLSACSSDDNAPSGAGTGGGQPAQPAAGTEVKLADSDLGKILTGPDGRTLYAFTNDKNGTSACYDQCAQNWPALTTTAAPTAGDGVDGSLLGTTTRTDGGMQVTYKGMPLYFFARDTAAGQTAGQGVSDVWWVVDSTGNLVKGDAAAAATVTVTKSSLGDILADAKGRTLYAFTNDSNGESACYDQCAQNWPALTVTGDPTAGDGTESSLLGTTTRTDGGMQVTYKGMPLYFFARDTAAGQTAGQGVSDVWWVVAPDGSLVKTAP